jgi:hypothetical protein
MSAPEHLSRRQLMQRLALSLTAAPLAVTLTAAADEPALLAVTAPEAKAVKYVEDAATAKDAQPGNNCGNCALYQGNYGSAQGPCQLFPGKAVKAAGWCSSWAPQM